MMDNDSYNGNYTKNLFNFQHYKLTQIGISVNGEELPFKSLKLNFDDKLFATAYNTLFSCTEKLLGNSESIIKRDYSKVVGLLGVPHGTSVGVSTDSEPMMVLVLENLVIYGTNVWNGFNRGSLDNPLVHLFLQVLWQMCLNVLD